MVPARGAGCVNIAYLLHRAAAGSPDAPAVCEGADVLRDYRGLAGRAAAIGEALLREYGLRAGDRVALAMRNTPLYPEVLFGVWWAGLVAVPMNARLHPREFARLVEDCGARVCVATGELTGPLGEQGLGPAALVPIDHLVGTAAVNAVRPPADVADDAPAWLFYTSGTTGRPKGATLTHGNLRAATDSALADIGAGVDASMLHIAPMSHAGGLFGLAHVARARAQVFPRGGAVTADTLEEALRAFGPVTFFAVPTILRRLLDPALLPDGLVPRVHRILYGGAPMYREDLERVIARFGAGRLWQGYGQGESPGTITHLRPEDHAGDDPEALGRRLASVGRARTGVEVRVADPDGREVPAGTTGEVLVRGATVMSGYWNAPEATARTLRGGWLHTGDLGRLDADGFLTLVDRAKDLVISGGSNIYPREVEEVLLRHPAVAEAAVVGAPDPEWGELPVAFVVRADGGADSGLAAALEAHCLGRMARFKRPRRFVFVAALPKNSYGKVLKTELRGLIGRPPEADNPRAGTAI
ncbi:MULTISPECIES: AMP-binding protein [Streptomyces]|nr:MULTISPECIES: AMP-binding protein [Streptomyces]MBC2876141.1 AMP-binding protein [Streptomyces sp. TYQ1024]UBI38498.1 AMP-binding protein [Streptomyces mobaraensis]UKW31082.1 AMP-binding protein [Streptomyces sp. TYQ1024]